VLRPVESTARLGIGNNEHPPVLFRRSSVCPTPLTVKTTRMTKTARHELVVLGGGPRRFRCSDSRPHSSDRCCLHRPKNLARWQLSGLRVGCIPSKSVARIEPSL